METFSALLAFVRGINRWQRPVTLWCFLWSAPWINGWVNNGETGDLTRHRAHYAVIVMPRSQTPRGESVAAHLLIIFSLVCKSDIMEAHGNLYNPSSEKIVRGEKHPREADKYRNNIPHTNHLILGKDNQHPIYDNQCPEKAVYYRQSLPHIIKTSRYKSYTPSVRHLNINDI